MKNRALAISGTCVVGLLFIGGLLAPAGAVVVPVDCSVPESINAAIASIAPPTPVEVEITNGPCAEDVIIRRDNVTIRPDPVGSPPFSITGAATPDPEAEGATVLIRDARRVTLDGVTITGGRHGVRVVASQEDIVFNDVDIDGNTVWGIQALQASNVIIEGSSSFDGNGRGGISVADAGAVTCRTCRITNSNVYGIRAVQGARVTFLGGSTIDVTGRGIFAEDSRVRIDQQGGGPGLTVRGTLSGVTAVHSEVEVIERSMTIEATADGGAAVDASGSSSVRAVGPGILLGDGPQNLQAAGSGAFALLLDGNSSATVDGARLTGAVSVRGMSSAIVAGSRQLSTDAPNSAIEGSYLAVAGTTLVGDTVLTSFAAGRFSGVTLENLDCRQKADALCQGGTTITGTSGCSGCAAVPPPKR